MINPIQKTEVVETTDLANETFPQFISTLEREELLENGCLINVTAWLHREMDFGTKDGRLRVHAAVTARLWRTLHRIPAALRFSQTVRGRGHDVLWLAAWSLSKARRLGLDCVYFLAPLPTDENEADCKRLFAQRKWDCPFRNRDSPPLRPRLNSPGPSFIPSREARKC